MNLIIDIGNSSSKVAVFNGNQMEQCIRCEENLLSEVKSAAKRFSPTQSIVSCVGLMPKELDSFLKDRINPIPFTNSTPIPIENNYKTPETLGQDRIAIAVGAYTLYPNRNVLAIDAGTTITYDIVSEQGKYIGGAISPGIGIRYKSLKQFTQKLPLLSMQPTFDAVGTDTESCIHSGVLFGAINEMDGYISRMKEVYNNLAVLVSGGDAFFFDKNLKNSIFANPFLVLIGLNRILNYNA